ncbi:MAG: YigZ family protein [Bacteroidaceae bacterium]|nr:YigZ family protein [Bacteroidaceae bacterium]
MEQDVYRTIEEKSEGYYTQLKSKFYSFAFPVSTVDDVKALVAEYRKKYYDARHVCYAYIIGADKALFRANDDGEPSGTAGKPIHGQIVSRDLTDVLVIVVRYYGGVNLGTGGLIEAYRTAAHEALEKASIVERFVEETIIHRFQYSEMNAVMKIVKDTKCTIIAQDFGNDCTITLKIRQSQADKLLQKLKNVPFS